MRTNSILDDDYEEEGLNEVQQFRPKFRYVFDEENPPVYRKVKVTNPDGTVRIRHYDVAKRIFVD